MTKCADLTHINRDKYRAYKFIPIGMYHGNSNISNLGVQRAKAMTWALRGAVCVGLLNSFVPMRKTAAAVEIEPAPSG